MGRTRPDIRAAVLCGLLALAAAGPQSGARAAPAPEPPAYEKKAGWAETLLGSRAAVRAGAAKQAAARQAEVLARLEEDFPMEWDWSLQDSGGDLGPWFRQAGPADVEKAMLERVLGELGPDGAALRKSFDELSRAGAATDDPRWLDLYRNACEVRRAARLRPLPARWPRIVFTKHFNMGGSHYAYTEGQSDAQAERHFVPGTALCILEWDGPRAKVRTLIEDPGGVIRDPDVSYDGKRILFAWKKSDRQDDYHLYELDAASGGVRQLTFGLGFADYEGCYLPDGNIIFNSTRPVQTVDCFWTEVSNLYTCDKDGRYLRRLTFDQVHTNFPAVLDDGRIIYTRWDYNDRGQIYPQGLFQMNPDGTAQTECYGNNSWFPTTILHARGIPGTEKIVAMLTGHHSRQTGKLAMIDPSMGRQEASGVQLIAPVQKTGAVHVDSYGQEGELFQYPYPLSETEYLVGYHPLGWQSQGRPKDGPWETHPRFKIYFMTIDGRRELLAADPAVSCNQPIPLAARPAPAMRASTVDYRAAEGIYYLQDIYAGPGLDGVPRGAIRKLRVVGLEFRAAGIGSNNSGGPAGGALSSTPVSIGNGAWDPKIVLGEATVYDDGSALFAVPARTPVYFQALDAKGHAVQTMRSWSTLQPGERFACVGCHESKNTAPPPGPAPKALAAGVERLRGFYGPPRGFSFPREIQPILDRHCTRCHNVPLSFEGKVRAAPPAGEAAGTPPDKAFSLLATEVVDLGAKRRWSEAYLALTQSWPRDRGARPSGFAGQIDGPWVAWVGTQSVPAMLPPYFAGAARSKLITLLEQGHYQVKLSREEMDKIACWIDLLVPYCGDYLEANAWDEKETGKYDYYLQKRRRMEEMERANIEALLRAAR
ncbi:MAG: hypothetical protein IMZ44_03890 [Planctomycetes bacterium]|nr:hypothetical protein [Planctomycetota bacterium]